MIYIDGEPFETLDGIPEVSLRDADFLRSEFDDEEGLNVIISANMEFECLARIAEETMLKIFGLWDAIIDCCPDRRVVHLMRYSKKRKVRRKNQHRAIKILEGMSDANA